MIPAVGANNARHFTHVQGEGRVLEGFLHHAPSEVAQIAIVFVAGAIGALRRVLEKGGVYSFLFNFRLVLCQLGHGSLGGEDDLLARATRNGVATVFWNGGGMII